jgi:5-methylcytosine-specific restriction endonuclease McrA
MAYKGFRTALLKEYNNCCAICGCADIEALHIDHAKSRKDGGTDDYSNLQILCQVCNSQIKRHYSLPRFAPISPVWDCRKWKKSRREFRKNIVKLAKKLKN